MNEQINIVYIISTLNVGGAQVGMYRLLNGLDKEKYHITVVSLDSRIKQDSVSIPSSVDLIRLYQSPDGHFHPSLKFLNRVRKADIIVGSLYHSTIAAKLCSYINQKATIATWKHNPKFKSQNRKTIFDWTKRLNDIILADSESVANTLIEELQVPESLIHTVPIAGINLNEYSSISHKNTSKPTVGSVGRIIEEKNFIQVLNVAEQLQESGIEFKIGGEGRLFDKLNSEINNRNITNVTLVGHVDDVPHFLSQLDIYFQPSRSEGLCITVLEAMATGLPVVGSNVGGIGNNVESGTSGLLYKPNNTSGFSSAIQKLAKDFKLREYYGAQARRTVAEQFTQQVLVSEFEKAIKTNQ